MREGEGERAASALPQVGLPGVKKDRHTREVSGRIWHRADNFLSSFQEIESYSKKS